MTYARGSDATVDSIEAALNAAFKITTGRDFSESMDAPEYGHRPVVRSEYVERLAALAEEGKSVRQAARILGKSERAVYATAKRNGVSFPDGRRGNTASIRQRAIANNVSPATAYARIYAGWDVDRAVSERPAPRFYDWKPVRTEEN